jgi:hypothetical protein
MAAFLVDLKKNVGMKVKKLFQKWMAIVLLFGLLSCWQAPAGPLRGTDVVSFPQRVEICVKPPGGSGNVAVCGFCRNHV